MTAEAGLETLAAIELSLCAALRAVREDLEQREQRLGDIDGKWRAWMSKIAECERIAWMKMQRTRVQLEEECRQHRAECRRVKRQRRELEVFLAGLTSEMGTVTAWNLDRVKLEVGGVAFEASEATLRRSPWLARELSDALIACEQPCAPQSRRRNTTLRVERDGGHFRAVLNYLRVGTRCLHSLESLPKAARAGLLKEAIFFELPDFAGALAEPPVGSDVHVTLPSNDLAARSIDATLLHDVCCSWHAPGRCFHARCRRDGMATTVGVVSAYMHDMVESKWMVECHGQVFQVPRKQIAWATSSK